MFSSLTVRQYHDWQRWFRHYKLSPDRDDHYWALWLTMYHNCHVEHGHQRSRFEDYLMVYDPLEKYEAEVTVDDILRNLGVRS